MPTNHGIQSGNFRVLIYGVSARQLDRLETELSSPDFPCKVFSRISQHQAVAGYSLTCQQTALKPAQTLLRSLLDQDHRLVMVRKDQVAAIVRDLPGGRATPEATWRPESWMEDLWQFGLGGLSLVQVALPGTHDSGTFALNPTEFARPYSDEVKVYNLVCRALNEAGKTPHVNCSDADELAALVAYPWAKTQVSNWTKQLMAGVRSIDYRGYYDKETKTWAIEHDLAGIVKDTDPQSLGSQALAFLEAHPYEFLVVEYCDYDDNAPQGELLALFQQAFGSLAYNWNEGTTIPGNPTLAQMKALNQRAILVACNGGYGPVPQGIQNDYPNSCNLPYILSYDGAEIASFAAQTELFMRKIGFQVTAGFECIVAGEIGHSDPSSCEPHFGFSCAADLLGYIRQLNTHFSMDYVMSNYFANSSITPSFYFGNIWNFDDTQPGFNYIVASLNAIVASSI